MARVYLKVAAGLSSTGSKGRVPAGALGLGGVGKQLRTTDGWLCAAG